jgi:hypothetical protein
MLEMIAKLLATFVLLATSSIALTATPFNSKLVGTWRSDDVSGGASVGALLLESSGKITLSPDGFDPLTGTWELDGPFIRVTVPNRGVALLSYTLTEKGKRLNIRYENGTFQFFTKQTTQR